MKTYIFTAFMAAALTASAQSNVTTLDLTKAETPLEFNESTGAWTNTFNEDELTIDSQLFTFLHNANKSYGTWWGYTASNSADNSMRDDFLTYQFSNMAKGGIVLNEDGTVKLDKFGAPEVSPEVPYLVAYADTYMAEQPCQIIMNDGCDHALKGMYVNLNSWDFYTLLLGNAYCRPFTNGDKFTLTVHAVNTAEEEKTLDITLASGADGDLTIIRDWKYVDLSSLGSAYMLWFTLKSTDTGAYGDNTPAYFCLDKLMVDSDIDTGVEGTSVFNPSAIGYDRSAAQVTLHGADFAIVYDAAGRKVMSADTSVFSVASLPNGVYMVKSGNSSRKIVK